MKRILPIIIGLMVISLAANAQLDDPLNPQKNTIKFLVGPSLGVNIVNHSTNLQVINATEGGDDPLCPSFTDGGNTGFFVGFTGEYLIGNVASSSQSIIARVLYSTMPASFEVESPSYPVISTSNGGAQVIYSTVSNSMELTYNLLTVEAQYKYNFFEGFGVIAGPSVDLVMAAEEEKLMKLTDSENLQFEDYDINNPEFIDGRTRNLDPDGDPAIDNAAAVRVGLKFGVQYEFNVPNAGYVIIPHLNYNLGVTSLADNRDWSVSAIQLGVDVRFGI